jgi:hypothetical protein
MKRTVAITLIIVAVLLTSVVGYELTNTPKSTPIVNPTSSPNVTPIDFTLSFSPTNSQENLIMQGSNKTITITLSQFSLNQSTTFSANDDLSGIQCIFSNQTNTQALLTMIVPMSTATGNYQITVTASVGQTSHSVPFNISVLSATVQVSGTIIFYPIKQANQPRIATLPSGIQFVQVHLNSTGSWIKGQTYTGVVADNSYSITVPNDKWYVPQIIDSSGTAYVCDQQLIYIGLQVGNTSTIENLSRE